MQRTNECRSRALVLMELAKEAPELKEQLLYVAQKWLTLAALREQFNVSTDRTASDPRAYH